MDLTRPWKETDAGSDARENVTDVGKGGSPGDVGDSAPIGPEVDDFAPFFPAERPVDAEQPPLQRDDAGPAESAPETSDGATADTSPILGDDGPIDAPPETNTGKADATKDAASQLADGANDLLAEDSRTAGDDAPLRVDRTPDLNVPVPDGSLADTSLDSASPPSDAGLEAPAISGLVASYPCESANGTELADTSGHGKNATLENGAGGTPVGFSFVKGRVGNALTLAALDQAYVSLPKGILSPLTQVTIATWVKLNASAAFQRIFDFGVDTNTFMYLVNAGTSGFMRFRIVSTPLNKNQVLEAAEALPVGRWTHVALTLGDNGVSLYLDGAQIAQQAPATLRPADLGDTGNNFIGRSPFAADPYLDGQVDEFRIYDRVLSPAEIGELANGQ